MQPVKQIHTVDQIIDRAGVTRLSETIARMSEAGIIRRRVTAGAISKWRKNATGIPETYWPAVSKLTGLTSEQLYAANLRQRGVELAQDDAPENAA